MIRRLNVSENKSAEEKREEFMKKFSNLFDEVKKSGDRKFSVLVIAVDETTLNIEYGIADVLIAAWGRKDLIGKCLCDLIDEDVFYKNIIVTKVLNEITPALEAKLAGEKH
jgi:hypothetical protein